MALLLSVLRCPDTAVPEQRRVPGGDYTIGRGADCDWVLHDPEGVLSRRHCVLEFRSGGWQIRDLSTNGTFVNHAAEPVGRDQVAVLSDGDRLRIGSYEIELRVEQDAAAPAWGGAAMGGGGGGGGGSAQPPWAAQDAAADTGWDPLAPPVPRGAAGPASALPEDFDPFADEQQTPMPDHRPSVDDAFIPSPVMPVGPPPSPGGAAHLGEDWDLDLSPPHPAPPAGPPLAAAAAALDDWDLSPPTPAAAAAAPPAAMPPATPTPPPATPTPPPPPIAAPPPAAAAPRPPAPSPQPAAAAAAPPPTPPVAPATPPRPGREAAAAAPAAAIAAASTDPFAEEAPLGAPAPAAPPPAAAARPAAAPPPIAPAAAPPHPAAGTGGSAQGLGAFLAGAGLSPAALAGSGADPDAALHGLGTAFRAIVAGLRALLIARADVKREFRIEQTLLRAAGNNPVKFAATDEAAVLALAAQGAKGVAAVEETIADLTAHQVATLAATQAAARALLDRLAPPALEEEVKGGGGLFGASREKLLWDAYRKLHQQVVEQFEDDFDSAFGKAFARAYEQAARRDDGGPPGAHED